MNETKKYAEVHFGKLGMFLPMLTMVGAILVMSFFKMRGISNMQIACFLAIVVGWLVYKDKKQFQHAVSEGVKSPVLAGIVPVILLSCILGNLLVAAKLSNSLLYWAAKINLSPAFMPLVIFVLGGVISMASGSSAAAISGLRPVILPMAYAMGCNPGLCAGALLSAGQVGDNLAPISDSTITSALTQEVDVTKAFRYRLKYSIFSAVVTAILYLVFGFIQAPTGESQLASADPQYASSIVFLIIPVIIMVIMLKTNNFFNAMLVGELLCVAMLLIFGYADIKSIFASDGVIGGGLTSAAPTIIFLMLVFIVISICKESGCMDAIKDMMGVKKGDSLRKTEIAAGIVSTISAAMIGACSSSISFAGPIVRDITRDSKISRARIASIVGGICGALGTALPWTTMIGVMPAMIISAGGAPEGFSGMDIVPNVFYCIIMFIVYWFLILTGKDRKIETDEELKADGIVIED